MAKKVSMDDIAKEIGVSKNTVSLALRGMPGISDKTRALILETANSYGYRYSKEKKSAPNPGVSKNICLIMSKSTRNMAGFFSFIQFGIEDEARKNCLNTIIHYYEEDGSSFEPPLSIKEGIVSGILTLGRITRSTFDSILSLGLPVVSVDHYFDNLKCDCILTDNHSGGYVAAEYLIRNGHSKIGFIGDIGLSNSFYDRHQGYLKALGNYRLTPHHSITGTSLENLALKNIEEVVEHLKSLTSLPTAFFCCNDAEALAVYKALSVMGIKIPDDISVMGFDDIESSRNIYPGLTTMRVEKEYMGKKAVTLLKSKMEGLAILEEKQLLTTRLIERHSVKKV